LRVSLSKHKPTDCSKEDWVKTWENSGYVLSALYKSLEESISSNLNVKPDDFSIPNHYALLAYEAGKRQAYQEVMDMLPESAKK
jgi:hypothetical protein